MIPAAPEQLSEYTLQMLMPLWMGNLANNLPKIRDENALDINLLPKKHGPCIIVGAGPSLDYFKHLNTIQNSGWNHPVLSCDKSLANCLKHKIIPCAVATVDGSSKVAGFYSPPIVRKHASKINGLFNVLSNPNVVDMWENYGGKVYWYTPMIDVPENPKGGINPHSLSYMMYLLTKQKSLISGFGNVGAFLWNVATELGCDPIILVGFDFSEQVKDKADTIYFQQFTNMFIQKYKNPRTAQDVAANIHQVEENPDFIADHDDPPYYEKGNPVRYLVNPVWKWYREKLAAGIRESGRHTINATGNGCLTTQTINAPNFEAKNLSEVLEKYGN